MGKFICLQAGHQFIAQNCIPSLRGGTGAPGEVDFTVKVRDALAPLLIARGFVVQLVDANANCQGLGSKNFDLFLAIHYDADVYGSGGGFVGVADPAVDMVNGESRRIRDSLSSVYFDETGIENHPERTNANVSFYYMWSFLSAKTPCVLIECGVGQNSHDKPILDDTIKIANAITRGICRAFNVPYDITPPTDKELLEATKKILLSARTDTDKVIDSKKLLSI